MSSVSIRSHFLQPSQTLTKKRLHLLRGDKHASFSYRVRVPSNCRTSQTIVEPHVLWGDMHISNIWNIQQYYRYNHFYTNFHNLLTYAIVRDRFKPSFGIPSNCDNKSRIKDPRTSTNGAKLLFSLLSTPLLLIFSLIIQCQAYPMKLLQLIVDPKHSIQSSSLMDLVNARFCFSPSKNKALPF